MKQRMQKLQRARSALQKLSATPSLHPDTKAKLDLASQSVDNSISLLNQYQRPLGRVPDANQAGPASPPMSGAESPQTGQEPQIRPPSQQQIAESGLPMGTDQVM